MLPWKNNWFFWKIVLLILVLPCTLYSFEVINLGKIGNTFSIQEKDALEEIIEKAEKLDWEAFWKNYSKLIYKHFTVNFDLPKAENYSVKKETPLYVLDINITDAYGNIIYPAGYTFNPLDYIKLPYTFVFFDGEDENEVKYVVERFGKTNNVYFFVTKGNILILREQFKKENVYPVNNFILDRFKVKKTVSVVIQEGNYLKIEEVPVKEVKEALEKDKKF